MGYILCFITFFVSFLIQSTILKNFAILGVTPDFLLILVVVTSLMFNEKYGMVYGTIFGFIQDICFFPITGASAMIYFIIGLVVYEMRRYLFRDNLFTIILIGACSVVFYHFMFWGIMVLFGTNYGFLYMLEKLPGRMLYNIVIILLMYKFVLIKIIRDKGDRYIW